MFPDPLRIHYLVVLADDALEDASPFQGFGPSWPNLIWAFELLAQLPADVLEPSHSIEGVIAQRMGGMRQLLWSPLSISPLERSESKELGFFVVLLSSNPDVTERVSAWMAMQPTSMLHVPLDASKGSTEASAFSPDVLRAYCRKVLEERGQELSQARREAVKSALDNWNNLETKPIDLKAWSHNITLPNHMVLARAHLEARDPESFHGKSEDEYTKVILDSVKAVEAVREEVGYRGFHRMSLIHPSLYLVEPAFYRHAYSRFRPATPVDRETGAVLRLMQTQRTLFIETDAKVVKGLLNSAAAQHVLAIRQQDLNIFTAAIGLKAAQTCSAVMRLSPGVNHVFPLLGNYARNIRAGNAGRLKTPRLFHLLQKQLADAVSQDRLKLIAEIGGPIKIISDAPIEWLPIDGLPLMLRLDCSRICSTPGNVLLAQLAMSEPVTISPDEIRRVLVISSFKDDDPLRNLLVGALNAISQQWLGKVEVKTQRVSSRAEFVDALNRSDAPILIFDGHGRGNSETGVATLRIGDENVDVWHLRGEARIPPIVILSACDTHGIDASSHATVGTGFLAAGAQTVLATMLPVGGMASASFVARLIYRLADFIPAALKANKRVLNWTEIISGMQRMLLASEILDGLVGPLERPPSPRAKIQSEANMHINTGDPEWFEWLLETIAKHRNESMEAVLGRANSIIARSEAIRYIQLGNPENILIDDGSIRDIFVPEDVQKMLVEG